MRFVKLSEEFQLQKRVILCKQKDDDLIKKMKSLCKFY